MTGISDRTPPGYRPKGGAGDIDNNFDPRSNYVPAAVDPGSGDTHRQHPARPATVGQPTPTPEGPVAK